MINNFDEYLKELSSSKCAPGGGSACCNALKIAFSLVEKSFRITMARKSFEKNDEATKKLFENGLVLLNETKEKLTNLETEDAKSFEIFMDAYKSKSENLNSCIKDCFNVSYEIFDCAYQCIYNCVSCKRFIVDSIISDFLLGVRLTKECLYNCLDNMKASASSAANDISMYNEIQKCTEILARFCSINNMIFK